MHAWLSGRRAAARLHPSAAQAQQISLNYHCKCEQFVHFACGGFFNFNGTAGALCPPHLHHSQRTPSHLVLPPHACLPPSLAHCGWVAMALQAAWDMVRMAMYIGVDTMQPSLAAGVWRRQAIEAAGGWNSRTTVEDMDLSLRAYLAGWKAIYLRDITVLNEARAFAPIQADQSSACMLDMSLIHPWPPMASQKSLLLFLLQILHACQSQAYCQAGSEHGWGPACVPA